MTPDSTHAVSTASTGRLSSGIRMLYEEFRLYYLPWVVAAGAIAVILWQQRTTLELVERINATYLERLADVSESLQRVNTTLQTDGYTLPPLGAVRESAASAP